MFASLIRRRCLSKRKESPGLGAHAISSISQVVYDHLTIGQRCIGIRKTDSVFRYRSIHGAVWDWRGQCDREACLVVRLNISSVCKILRSIPVCFTIPISLFIQI
jgi:hypothetical protein